MRRGRLAATSPSVATIVPSRDSITWAMLCPPALSMPKQSHCIGFRVRSLGGVSVELGTFTLPRECHGCAYCIELVASFANHPNLLKYKEKRHVCAVSTPM